MFIGIQVFPVKCSVIVHDTRIFVIRSLIGNECGCGVWSMVNAFKSIWLPISMCLFR